ncbi:hypothetical protein GUITHDRAFT_136861 [Guillardia theta CCMP2712]|uniref:B30.2/SPRY domain-containing protein n=1 Tax=Guillardia theta (strain CCMP2712) TaxID=905079 RepID=L1JJ79_GUITC|nr:hypothetical protein GUITHDRAFT_136861 [Guillardia theta CCMP2712]EKX48352.1 hypothetical protein GUITHDRAFT_136861 [Guillardia theta CCMP2712]|eukprot:XP_005835332.1 hypothetical protein GUITHDRAFT_136861 [Guillardia theta CCMP2712]
MNSVLRSVVVVWVLAHSSESFLTQSPNMLAPSSMRATVSCGVKSIRKLNIVCRMRSPGSDKNKPESPQMPKRSRASRGSSTRTGRAHVSATGAGTLEREKIEYGAYKGRRENDDAPRSNEMPPQNSSPFIFTMSKGRSFDRSSGESEIVPNGEDPTKFEAWNMLSPLRNGVSNLGENILRNLPTLNARSDFEIPDENLKQKPSWTESEYKETSSIRFRDGWAESFPSAVDAASGDINKLPTRIPFLFGTQRGKRAAMAVLAPPESTSLYKRIPFLLGSTRPPSEFITSAAGIGMGEDVSNEEEELRALMIARQRAEHAMQALQRNRGGQSGDVKPFSNTMPSFVPTRPSSPFAVNVGTPNVQGSNEAAVLEVCSFDESILCNDMHLIGRQKRTVTKIGRLESASFALWGKKVLTGVSEWVLRVEKQTGVIFVGVMEEPQFPSHGFARNLGTRAWMLGSYGYVCKTERWGQRSLTEDAKRQVGDPRVGALSFGTGTIIRIVHDRNSCSLTFEISNEKKFTIPDVSPIARPFVNIACGGDSVSIIDPSVDTERVPLEELEPRFEARAEVSADQMEKIRAEAENFWT